MQHNTSNESQQSRIMLLADLIRHGNVLDLAPSARYRGNPSRFRKKDYKWQVKLS
jgi:hypothetical protein